MRLNVKQYHHDREEKKKRESHATWYCILTNN